MKSNFLHTFSNFLKLLGAKVTKNFAEQFLESHRDKDSISDYTDALNHFNFKKRVTKTDLGVLWSNSGFIYFFGSFFVILLSISTSKGQPIFICLQLIFSLAVIIFFTYYLYYQVFNPK